MVCLLNLLFVVSLVVAARRRHTQWLRELSNLLAKVGIVLAARPDHLTASAVPSNDRANLSFLNGR